MTTRFFFTSLAVVLLCSSASAQWLQTNAPAVGVVYSLVVSTGDGGTDLFAGVYNGGVYRSTDNGVNWTQVNTGLTTTLVYAVAVSPATDGTGSTNLFAGTKGDGIFRSTDRGESWTAVNTGLTRWYITALAVASNGTGGANIFAGTVDMGVFRSTDNGAGWTEVNTGLPNFDSKNIVSLTVIGTDLYACTWGGLFRSTNSAESWTQVTGIESAEPFLAFTISGTDLLVGARNSGIFRSTDNGTSWSTANIGLTSTNVRAFANSGANLFAGTSGGVFLSTDNGASWFELNDGLSSTSVYSLAVIPGSGGGEGMSLFAGTTGGGICLLNNSNQRWTAVSTGLTDMICWALAASGSDLYTGTYGGKVFFSPDDGTSWSEATQGLGTAAVQSLAFSGTNLFAGTKGDGVFLSTNMGTSWTAVNKGLTRLDIPALALCPTGSGSTSIFAGSADMGVYRSTDNGAGWTQVNTGLPNWDSKNVLSLTVVGTNLYACTWGGLFLSTNSGDCWTQVAGIESAEPFWAFTISGTDLFVGTRGDGIFRSTDNGASWSAVNDGLTSLSISEFAVCGTYLYAATFYGGVFLSTNSGANWTSVNLGLTSKNVYALLASGKYLFAGTWGAGVFRIEIPEISLPITLRSFSAMPLSQDGSVTVRWETMSEIDNYGFVLEKALAQSQQAFTEIPGSFTPGQGTTQEPHTYTFVDKNVTSGKWAYRLKQIDLDGTVHVFEPAVVEMITTGVRSEPAVPTVTCLLQNYPNPFNPVTKIEYAVSGLGCKWVRIAVYDQLGREVAVLHNEMKEPGSYEVGFDGSELSSGVYFYRMQAGEFVQTRSLLLLK